MLPLECRYLNKSALTTLAGPLTPPVKHFQLKRKPKSATLRAELLQKCECCPAAAGGRGRGALGWGLGRGRGRGRGAATLPAFCGSRSPVSVRVYGAETVFSRPSEYITFSGVFLGIHLLLC